MMGKRYFLSKEFYFMAGSHCLSTMTFDLNLTTTVRYTHRAFLQSRGLKNIIGIHHVAAMADRTTNTMNFARYLAPSLPAQITTSRIRSATPALLQDIPSILKNKKIIIFIDFSWQRVNFTFLWKWTFSNNILYISSRTRRFKKANYEYNMNKKRK